MKVLLYSEAINLIKISGLGRAIMHQQRALQMNGAEYTLDPRDDYDIVHINTLGPKSRHLAKKARKAGKRVVYHAHSTEEDFRNSFVFSNAISGLVKRWICSCYIIRDIPVFGWLTDGRDCYKAKDRTDFERLICSVTAGRSASLRKNGRAAVQDMDLRLIGRKLISVYDGTAEQIAQA